MAALAAGSPDVYSYAVFGGPLLPGTTASIDIDAPADAELTVAAMLICTNDGFTGVSGAGLDGAPLSIDADAYDAGSEMNTEVSTDIVDPCGEAGPVAFPADGDANPEEDDVIQMHPGITGDGDLEPGEHGWSGPVLAIGVNQAEEPTPTPTATATPTEVPATATATPTSSPTPVPATATPTRAAPEPPETGSGLSGAGGGSDQLWLLVTASAIIVAGAAVASLTLRRRSAR
jgi:hypothetical protein